MAESKTDSQSKELTEEQKAAADKAEAEKKAQAEEEKKLKARIKAAQTREEVLEVDEKGKPKKTKTVQSDLLPDEKERHVYHVELESPAFDPKSGKRLSKPRVQMFKQAEFGMFMDNASKLGLEAKVLWNPVEYSKQ